MEIAGQGLHAQPEDAGDFVETQSEEDFDLRAGEEDGDAVGESDDDRTRNELNAGDQAGHAHDDQEHARHHGTHAQPVDAVRANDSSYNDDEAAGSTAALSV